MLRLVVLAFVTTASFAGTIAGRIVEERSGSPIASADVRIYKVGARTLAAELESDGDGRFQAPGLAEGEYCIEISKANHIPATLRTKLAEAEQLQFPIRVIRCGAIEGQVLDVNRNPIRGAHVFVLRSDRGPIRAELNAGRFAAVNDGGRYRLFNLPPGQYVIAAAYGSNTVTVGSTGRGYLVPGLGSGVAYYPSNDRPQTFTIASGQEFRNIDFAILPTNQYSVSGSVESSGSGANGAHYWVSLAPANQPAIAVAVTEANADGSFRLEGLPPGSYILFTSGPSNARSSRGAELPSDALYARLPVTIGSQDVEGIRVAPEKGRSATISLTAPPAGCAGKGELVLFGLEDWGANLERRAPISSTSKAIFRDLPPARYQVSVSGLGETCFVPEDGVLDLTASNGSLTLNAKAIEAKETGK
jgi:hypothetical protein